MTDTFSPDEWLVSAMSALQDYISDGLKNSILDADSNPAGDSVFEVVMEYPSSDAFPTGVEAGKTVIHLEIDDIDNRSLGMGENFVQATIQEGTPDDPGYIIESEAAVHVINLDVGIWSSDNAGGPSNRLLAYQVLDSILQGPIARAKCMEQTEGVEITSFMNGRFVTENMNDVRLFRMVGGELVVRVYSRKLSEPEIIVDRDSAQNPELTIDSIPLTED